MEQLKTSYRAMFLAFALVLWPGMVPAAELAEAQRTQAITALLAKAERALAGGRLTDPSGDNAVAYAQEVLDLAPEHPGAQRILRDVVSRYGVFAEAALDRVEAVKQQELAKANTFRARGEQIAERHGLYDERLHRVDERIAALEPESLQSPIEEHPLVRKVVSRLIERYADKAEHALNRGNVAGARSYRDIARDLASNYRIPIKARADLGGRVEGAEQARPIGPIAQTEVEQPAGALHVSPREFKAVFIPPAF